LEVYSSDVLSVNRFRPSLLATPSEVLK